jgi:hypothetical protein
MVDLAVVVVDDDNHINTSGHTIMSQNKNIGDVQNGTTFSSMASHILVGIYRQSQKLKKHI